MEHNLSNTWKDVLAIAARYDCDPVKLMAVFTDATPLDVPLTQVVKNVNAVKIPATHDDVDDLLDHYSMRHQGGTTLQDEPSFREAARHWLGLPKGKRRTSRECYEEAGLNMPLYSKALSNFIRSEFGGGDVIGHRNSLMLFERR